MQFLYKVVQILPDRELFSRFRFVSAVRAPIWLGIGPGTIATQIELIFEKIRKIYRKIATQTTYQKGHNYRCAEL